MAQPDEYVCSLDAKSLKKAEKELGEKPKERLGAVQTLRDWVNQQPHIKCDTSKYNCIPHSIIIIDF